MRQVLNNVSWLAVGEDEQGDMAAFNLVALLTKRRKRTGDLSLYVSTPGCRDYRPSRPFRPQATVTAL